MSEEMYLRYCPKHGHQGEKALTCPKCGKPTILSDITRDDLTGWLVFGDSKEKLYPYLAEKSFKVGLEKILPDLRSGKKGKVEKALSLLAWRPEHDDYIAEVVPWYGELKEPVTLFLSRCSYEKVRPYLDFRNYNFFDKTSVKLFTPLFLEHYKHRRPLPCEACRQETGNLFIKIRTEKKVNTRVRHVGHVTQKLDYTGSAVPHALCDACILKYADKLEKLRGLPDAEKIRGYIAYNADLFVKTCGDAGDDAALRSAETLGFNYEYLISPQASEEMMRNEADRAVLAGMIECALDVKEELDRIT